MFSSPQAKTTGFPEYKYSLSLFMLSPYPYIGNSSVAATQQPAFFNIEGICSLSTASNIFTFNYDNALDIAKKTIKSIGGLPLSKQKEAIYTRLQRMGFNYDHISSVLNKITYNELDYDLLEKEYLKLKSKETDKQKIISKLLTKGYNFQDIKRVIQE